MRLFGILIVTTLLNTGCAVSGALYSDGDRAVLPVSAALASGSKATTCEEENCPAAQGGEVPGPDVVGILFKIAELVIKVVPWSK